MRRILAFALLLVSLCAPVQAQSVGNANNFVVGAVASGGPFDKDTFTVGSNTLLENHLDDLGNTWTKANCTPGSLEALSSPANTVSINSATSGTCVYVDGGTPASANYTVSMNVKAGASSGSRIGVVGRSSSNGQNLYLWFIECSTAKGELFKSISGTLTQLGSSVTGLTCTNTASGTTISLILSGSSISGTFGGTTEITQTDSSITSAGLAGAYANNLGLPQFNQSTAFKTFLAQ